MTNQSTPVSNNLAGRSGLSQRTRTLTYTALMAAISTVVMFFEFTFPPFPPFLKFDLSGLPILLTAFIMGPVQAVVVTLIKDLFHVLSTTTGGVGELADFLILSAFALTAGTIHRKMPSVKGTAIACLCGTVVIAIVGALANYFLLIPFFSQLMPIDAIIAACNAVNPAVDSLMGYILFGAVPFNMAKGIVISVVTVVTYKKLAHVMKFL